VNFTDIRRRYAVKALALAALTTVFELSLLDRSFAYLAAIAIA
jgi:hypothetical protein